MEIVFVKRLQTLQHFLIVISFTFNNIFINILWKGIKVSLCTLVLLTKFIKKRVKGRHLQLIYAAWITTYSEKELYEK
jgi:hypothetical protein